MRIHGRLLRPSNLAERRLFLGVFGTSALRIPRKYNIFSVARRVDRYLKKNEDLVFLKTLARPARRPLPPIVPGTDSPDLGDDHAAAAE